MDNLTDLELEKWFNTEVDHYWSSKTTKSLQIGRFRREKRCFSGA